MRQIKRILAVLLSLVFLFAPVSVTSVEEAAEAQNAAVSAEGTAVASEAVTRVQEIEFLREKNSETYLMSDGKFECVVYADNKYYADADGQLKLIDNSIVRTQNTGPLVSEASKSVYKNAANEFDIFFGDATEPKVDIRYQGKTVTFAPVTADRKNGEKNQQSMAVGKVENCTTLEKLTSTGSNTVTYKNAFTGADLIYVLSNNALKEYIVLSSADAAGAYSFLFTLDGVKLQESEKYAQFVDEKGNAIFALDSLFAVDADGVLTEELTYSFTPVEGTNNIVVTVTLDEDYIKSPDRTFPVVIDPTIMISSSETADACVCSYTPDTNYQMATQLRTGFDVDYGIRRSYIKFNIPDGIPQNSITSATLDIEKLSGSAPTMRAYLCTEEWSSATITWRNKPMKSTAYPSSVASPRATGSSWYSMDVTTGVRKWVDAGHVRYGFEIRDNETNINHWTTLYSSDAPSPHKPELHITFECDSVTVQPIYDMGYAGKYGNAATGRITRHLEALQDKYYEEFGIVVTFTTPTLFTSYASSHCYVTADELCYHGTVCRNSEFGEDNLETLHHTNFWNIAYRIGAPSSSDTVKMAFLGQTMCVANSNGQCSPVGFRGHIIDGNDTVAIISSESEQEECLTAIHEFGHLYGILDHYSLEESGYMGTDMMNRIYGYRGYTFSETCIYGEGKFNDNAVNANVIICEGCRSWVLENRDRYSD